MITEAKKAKIETWYDRHTRSWVTQATDKQGNQLGEAEYNGTKQGAKVSHDKLTAKYNN